MKESKTGWCARETPGASIRLARALSRLGYCSRSEAVARIRAGRVMVGGKTVLNPDAPLNLRRDRIRVDGVEVGTSRKVYLALNKPRGLVTTRQDEHGRGTVYSCLQEPSLPWVSPVGRLDKASEGLLLFTNDTHWAARITAPETHLDKVYHVQVDCLADTTLVEQRLRNTRTPEGDCLSAKRVRILRHGEKNSWLEVVLDEGKNRQIRRLLDARGIQVLRLIRVAIGTLELGNLAKGAWRHLTEAEVRDLGRR